MYICICCLTGRGARPWRAVVDLSSSSTFSWLSSCSREKFVAACLTSASLWLNRKKREKQSSSVVATTAVPFAELEHPFPPPPNPLPPLVDSSRCFTSRVCVRSHCQPARRVHRFVSRRKRRSAPCTRSKLRVRAYTRAFVHCAGKLDAHCLRT